MSHSNTKYQIFNLRLYHNTLLLPSNLFKYSPAFAGTPPVIPAKLVPSRKRGAGIQICSPAFYAGFVPFNRQYYTIQWPDYQENRGRLSWIGCDTSLTTVKISHHLSFLLLIFQRPPVENPESSHDRPAANCHFDLVEKSIEKAIAHHKSILLSFLPKWAKRT